MNDGTSSRISKKWKLLAQTKYRTTKKAHPSTLMNLSVHNTRGWKVRLQIGFLTNLIEFQVLTHLFLKVLVQKNLLSQKWLVLRYSIHKTDTPLLKESIFSSMTRLILRNLRHFLKLQNKINFIAKVRTTRSVAPQKHEQYLPISSNCKRKH